MKAKELRELSSDELSLNLTDLRETLFNLRFQHEIGQLENPKKILHVRRDVARLKTILAEKF